MVVKRDMDLYLYFRRRTVGCFLTTALCRQLRTPTGRLVVRMEGRLSCPTRGCGRIYVECERDFRSRKSRFEKIHVSLSVPSVGERVVWCMGR